MTIVYTSYLMLVGLAYMEKCQILHFCLSPCRQVDQHQYGAFYLHLALTTSGSYTYTISAL